MQLVFEQHSLEATYQTRAASGKVRGGWLAL